MSYPGDPAGGQQQPAYPYSDGGSGYPHPSPPGGFGAPQPPAPAGGGFGAPPPSSGAGAFGTSPHGGGAFGAPPQSGPPASGYGSEPGPAYGGSYGYDPNMPPVSGPAFGGPPTMAMGPQGGPPLGSPPIGGPSGPRRSPLTAIFASLMVFFLLATAIMTVLYVTRTGDFNEQKKTSAQRQDTINTLNSDVEKLKNDVKRIEGERDAARRDLGGAQSQSDELKRQKQVISNCLNLAGEAADAAEAGNAALAQQKRDQARPVCEEAGRYLD